MLCPSCGETNPDGAPRCDSCFTYLGPMEHFGVGEHEVGVRFCHKCGKKNPLGSPQCARCERVLADFIPLATIVNRRFLVLADWAPIRLAGHMAIDMENEDFCTVRVGILAGCTTHDEREMVTRRVACARNYEHPNVVGVRSFGAERGLGYVVFEHVTGRDLETVLADEGHPWMATERALALADRVLLALEYIHARRPINYFLDMGPERLLMSPGGPMLLPLDGRSSGKFLGRSPYRAPETFWEVEPTPAAEVFTFSALLHHLLSGEAPISRSAWDYPPLRSYHPQIPETLEAIVARGLRLRREERYQSPSYMHADMAVAFPEHFRRQDEPVVVESMRPATKAHRKHDDEARYPAPTRPARLTSHARPQQATGGKRLLRGVAPAEPRVAIPIRSRERSVVAPAPAVGRASGSKGGLTAPAEPDVEPPGRARPWHRQPPRELWVFHPSTAVMPSFNVGRGHVVAATADGCLHALDAETGQEIWQSQAPHGAWRTLHLHDDAVVGQEWSVPATDERSRFMSVRMFDLKTGQAGWERGTEICPIDAEASSVAVVQDTVCVLLLAYHQGVHLLRGLDRATGQVRWTRDFLSATAWVGACGQGVYLWNEVEGLLQIEVAGGQTQWSRPDLKAWETGRHGPCVHLSDGEMIFLKASQGADAADLVCLGADRGDLRWRRHLAPPLGNARQMSPQLVTVAGEHVLCSVMWEFRGTPRNSLYCVDPRTGLPGWMYDARSYIDAVSAFPDEILLVSTPPRADRRWGPFASETSSDGDEALSASTPLQAARRRFVAGNAPFRAVDARTGRELWRHGVHHKDRVSYVLEVDGQRILAAGSDGKLYALGWGEEDPGVLSWL